MINPINHYSIENVPTAFDEEALTVLELVGRLTAKVNEVVKDYNSKDGTLVRMDATIKEIDRHLHGIADTLGEVIIEPLGFATPQMFGATGDGETDDTQAIKAAIQALGEHNATLFFPEGTYLVTEDIELRSNMTVKGVGASSIILRAPNDESHYRVFRCMDVSNIVISDITIQGDKDEHTGVDGEWGNCLSLEGAHNITIERCYLLQGWGDGVYISGGTHFNKSFGVNIRDTKISDNRRNGISVISVDGLTIDGCTISYTGGTAPEAGIDFEPNELGQGVLNVKISNTNFTNNTNDVGFADTTSNLYFEKQVLFTGCVFKSKSGMDWRTPLTKVDTAPSIGGYVKFSGCQFLNSTRCVRITKGNWDTPITLVGCDLSSNSIAVEIGESGKTFENAVLGGLTLLDCRVLKNGNNPIVRGVGSGATFADITADLHADKSIQAYGYFSGTPTDIHLDFHEGVYKVTTHNNSFDKYKVPTTLCLDSSLYQEVVLTMADTFPVGQVVRVINNGNLQELWLSYGETELAVPGSTLWFEFMVTTNGKIAVRGA